MSIVWLISLGLLAVVADRPADNQRVEPTRPASDDSLDDLTERALAGQVAALGAAAAEDREAAMQRLLQAPPEAAPFLNEQLAVAEDPEVRRRLRFVVENLLPPDFAVLVVDATPSSAARPGELITHVNGRRVRDRVQYQSRTRPGRAVDVRVYGAAGPREVTGFDPLQVRNVAEITPPLGADAARIVRLYADGCVEQSYAVVKSIGVDHVRAALGDELFALIAFTAGDAPTAERLLADRRDLVEPVPSRNEWTAPSMLDLAGPATAPHALAWRLWGDGARSGEGDPDLRVQRVLVPARRYASAIVRSSELWSQFRQRLNASERDARTGGNMLAVVSWMCAALDLRAECCRLIEPRSQLLRGSGNLQKWVRVDTDAWLPFFAGDPRGALTAFKAYARPLLAQPPSPDDGVYTVQNPEIAARLAFFQYRFPEDEDVIELRDLVARPGHPGLPDYFWWMLYGVTANNADAVHRDALRLVEAMTADQWARFAPAIARLEYAREGPALARFDRVSALLRRAADDDVAAAGRAEVAALRALAADESDAPSTGFVGADVLTTTHAFRAAHGEAVAGGVRVLAAVPLQQSWLVLTADAQLAIFDPSGGSWRPMAPPSPEWWPGPWQFPWLGFDRASGRAWVYDRRRVIEITQAGETGRQFNLEPTAIRVFHAQLAPFFSHLDDAVTAWNARTDAADPEAEDGEFLRVDVRSFAAYTTDPNHPEISGAVPTPNAPAVTHVMLRGGPQLLIDRRHGVTLDSVQVMDACRLPRPPRFYPRAAPRGAASIEADAAKGLDERLYLLSDQGLLVWDRATGAMRRRELPGDQPHAALIPESAPYERRDPRFFYFARLPDAGGQVFRMNQQTDEIVAVDLVNVVLPPEYWLLHRRSEIRGLLTRLLRDEGLAPLSQLIAEAQLDLADWRGVNERAGR